MELFVFQTMLNDIEHTVRPRSEGGISAQGATTAGQGDNLL
jgi:hypothetical protein